MYVWSINSLSVLKQRTMSTADSFFFLESGWLRECFTNKVFISLTFICIQAKDHIATSATKMRFKFVLWWTCNSTRTQAKPHVTRDLTSHFGMINVIHSFPLHYCVLLCQVKTLPDEYTLLLKCLPLVCCFFTKQRVKFYLGGKNNMQLASKGKPERVPQHSMIWWQLID